MLDDPETREQCPFGHGQVRLLETISTARLARAYHSRYGVSVGSLLGDSEALAFWQCSLCHISFFSPARPGSSEFYEELSRIPWYYSPEKDEYKIAVRYLKSDDHVLEVGCGNGGFASYIKQAPYVGLELNARGIAAARAKGLDVRAEMIENFARNHAAKFDAVCAFQVLEHVADPASFISACTACAKPGGLVMFGVPNADAFIGAKPDDLLNMPPHHMTWWDKSVFLEIAPQFGLEVVAIEECRLSPDHRASYVQAAALRYLMSRLRIKRIFFFDGPLYRAMNVAAWPLRQLMQICLADHRFFPLGHTVLVILRRA